MQETLILDIESLSHDGRGIARLPMISGSNASGRGLAVFVHGALPGQRVVCRILRRSPRLMEAVRERLLASSPDIGQALCPHQTDCGGCPLQPMDYAAQLRWKKRLVLEALVRIGRLDRGELDSMLPLPFPSPRLTCFRNKMTFAFGQMASGDIVLGLRRPFSAEILPTPGCVLMPPVAQDMVAVAQASAARSGLPPLLIRHGRRSSPEGGGFWRFLTLRRGNGFDGQEHWWAICLTSPASTTERAAVRKMGESLLAAFPKLAAFAHEERNRRDWISQGENSVCCMKNAAYEEHSGTRMQLPLGGRTFACDIRSFFQVNTEAAQTLASLACSMLYACAGKNSQLIDLYCGVGAPGQLAAHAFSRLTGVECDGLAASMASVNAQEAGLSHCRYLTGDAESYLDGLISEGDYVILADPPRSGLALPMTEKLLGLQPRGLVYISCNATTLARDAARLSDSYRLACIACVDIFPHTPHAECCTLWLRR